MVVYPRNFTSGNIHIDKRKVLKYGWFLWFIQNTNAHSIDIYLYFTKEVLAKANE